MPEAETAKRDDGETGACHVHGLGGTRWLGDQGLPSTPTLPPPLTHTGGASFGVWRRERKAAKAEEEEDASNEELFEQLGVMEEEVFCRYPIACRDQP